MKQVFFPVFFFFFLPFSPKKKKERKKRREGKVCGVKMSVSLPYFDLVIQMVVFFFFKKKKGRVIDWFHTHIMDTRT
jgi:hypothetical protein